MNYYKKSKLNSIINIPLFLIWPFGAFLNSLRHIDTKWNGLVFVAFCTLFGYSFEFSNTSADSYRIALVFTFFDSSISEVIHTYLRGGYPDLYRFLMYSSIKDFGIENPKCLYAVFGFFFGVFWYLSLKLFFKSKNHLDLYTLLLMVVFIFINPIVNVNGVRMNTAMWVYFFSSLKLLLYDDKKWVLGLVLSTMMHFSFIAIVIPTLLFKILHKSLHNNRKIYKPLLMFYLFSLCLSYTNLGSNFGYLNEKVNISNSINNKLKKYNNEDMAEHYKQRSSNSTFLKVSGFFGKMMRIYFAFLILYIWKSIKNGRIKDKLFVKLFAFVLFFYCISHTLSLLPSGGRFGTIASMLLIFSLGCLYRVYRSRKIQYLILGLLPIYSFKILYSLYLSFSLTTHNLWFNNFIALIEHGRDFTFNLGHY